MPARSLWSGTVSFGLVAIPVGIVSAVRPQKISFHLLHDQDHTRLERKMFCPQHNTYVHPEHIVKGYPIDSDNYVVVTQDEINSLEPERSQTIEITDFVELDAIDPIFYDRPYYLEPRKGGQKPYLLLARALESTKKAGIATFVMHDRQYLVAVRSINGALCLVTLHYTDDISDPGDIVPKNRKADSRLVDELAKKIKKISTKFEPEKYVNDYQEKIKKLMEQKIEQGKIVESAEFEGAEEEEQPPDLMAALEESLKKAQKAHKKKNK